ncbi:hypothetical protein T439DRAFT_335478 [Meredithblackwellia eburnea MCA 4105]
MSGSSASAHWRQPIDARNPPCQARYQDWTKEDESKLVKLVAKHGTNWRIITAHFQEREWRDCRNAFYKLPAGVAFKEQHEKRKSEKQDQVDIIASFKPRELELRRSLGKATSKKESERLNVGKFFMRSDGSVN